jgi:hypothetical protein
MYVRPGVKSIFHFMSELSWEHVSLAAMRLQLQENVNRAHGVLPCRPSRQFCCFEVMLAQLLGQCAGNLHVIFLLENFLVYVSNKYKMLLGKSVFVQSMFSGS